LDDAHDLFQVGRFHAKKRFQEAYVILAPIQQFIDKVWALGWRAPVGLDVGHGSCGFGFRLVIEDIKLALFSPHVDGNCER
jgi:hypothetical protein